MGNNIIRQAFIFDSLIKDVNVYQKINQQFPEYADLYKKFADIREQSVDLDLETTKRLYNKLIDNIFLTDVVDSSKEKFDIIEKYFIRDFYQTPVHYGIHLLNFNKPHFIEDHVVYKGLNEFLLCLKKFKTVILNPMHNDLYQMLTNYLSILLNENVISLYGLEKSLRKIEKINSIYTPSVTNIEYNYVNNIQGLPNPLIFRKSLVDIKEGKLVAIPPEISMGLGPKNTVNFLGRPVTMPIGSSWLSNKTQKPIVIVHTELLEKSKIVITFENPIFPYRDKTKQNILKQSQTVFKEIERVVKTNPVSWCGYDIFDKIVKEH